MNTDPSYEDIHDHEGRWIGFVKRQFMSLKKFREEYGHPLPTVSDTIDMQDEQIRTKPKLITKDLLRAIADREAQKCIAEGHSVPEGEMCRRQYARNVLQELLDL